MSASAHGAKITVERKVLSGMLDGMLQRVATVYLQGLEYRVSAPPKAAGDAIDWLEHFVVVQPYSFNAEVPVYGPQRLLIIGIVKEELERLALESDIWSNTNQTGTYCAAQICLGGHVQSSDGTDFKREDHCSKCGAVCIDVCQSCKAPIRGSVVFSSDYERPSYCYKCGIPYPWMQDRLTTARELLYHDDKLSLDERNELWSLLQSVMSDPKADLVPAKKKLIDIKLGKAAALTKDIVLDLVAKITAEVLKP